MNYNENKYSENMLKKYGLNFTVEENFIFYLLVCQLDYDKEFYLKLVDYNEIIRIDLKQLINKFEIYFKVEDLDSVYLTYYEFYTIVLFLEYIVNSKKFFTMFYLVVCKEENIKKSSIKKLYRKIDNALQEYEVEYRKLRKRGLFR